MSSRSDRSGGGELGSALGGIIYLLLVFLFLLVLPALFMISVLITKLLLKSVYRSTDSGLAGNEGLVLLVTAGLWSLVLSLLSLPLAPSIGLDAVRSLPAFLVVGGVWGCAVGYQALCEAQEELIGLSYSVASLIELAPDDYHEAGPGGSYPDVPVEQLINAGVILGENET